MREIDYLLELKNFYDAVKVTMGRCVELALRHNNPIKSAKIVSDTISPSTRRRCDLRRADDNGQQCVPLSWTVAATAVHQLAGQRGGEALHQCPADAVWRSVRRIRTTVRCWTLSSTTTTPRTSRCWSTLQCTAQRQLTALALAQLHLPTFEPRSVANMVLRSRNQ